MALFAPPSILDLSDDVLLLIFSYLKARDLITLTETCERFSKVANDKSLWSHGDFSGGCLSLQQLKKCLKFLRATTRRIILRGYKKKYAGTPKWKTPLISASVLKVIGEKCPNLEELTISEAYIDAAKLKVTDFSPVNSIKKFCIIDCEFVNLPALVTEGSYFKKTHKILPRLECLKITKCGWVDDYDVMVLSKVDTLRRLVLRHVPKVGRAMAYIALGFRFGFQNLEELDLRGTSLEDNEVISVVQNGKLKALYLGPMGPVKRLPEEPPGGHNLVMPDPRWQEERQQVVVINVGPNGPQWRQVNDEELDGLGLNWVRNAPMVQRNRAEEEDEDRHYFIGRDGRPVEQQDNHEEGEEEEDNEEEEGENAERGAREQQPLQRPTNQQPQQQESRGETHDRGEVAKRPRRDDGESSKEKDDEEEEEEEGDTDEEFCDDDYDNASEDLDDDLTHEPYNLPDEGLSDKLVYAFGPNSRLLHTLVVSGCAITDMGLQEIIRLVPTLKLLDVTNTKVTGSGVQEARVARPDCVILGGGTRVVRQQNNR